MDVRHVLVDAAVLADVCDITSKLVADGVEDVELGKVVIRTDIANLDALRGAVAELRARALTPA